MQHLILGYGYCGYYLAQELLDSGQSVTAVSRHLNPDWALPGLTHHCHDLQQPLHWHDEECVVYYLIAPPSTGTQDAFLRQFLKQNRLKAKKVIYFGSSGVYGDHQGQWVTEESPCHLTNDRQLRRLDAEQQWLHYGQQLNIDIILLRIAGIFGPHRLPVDAAKAQLPMIETQHAPVMNHIYVKDLGHIAYLLSQTTTSHQLFNVADGQPEPMGTLQELVAKFLQFDPAPYESWENIWSNASPMKREFMESSKRLNINRLQHTLQERLTLTNCSVAIKNALALMV